MRSHFIHLAAMASVAAILIGCAGSQQTDSSPSPSSSATPGRSVGVSAATGSGDYLQDCLARIPKDATSGQRAIAERTCARDVADRTTTSRGDNASSGTQGDTLQACMARIPQDASAGQRMIAEQSCERDEASRRSVQIVPGR